MTSIFEKAYKFCPTCTTKLIRKPIDRRSLLACPKCGFIFWNNPKPVVSIILHHNNHVLMLQRAKKPLLNYWVLPGGFIDYEETAEQAIIRECKEEAGITITQPKLIGVYQIDNDPSGRNIDIIYEHSLTKEINISEEHSKSCFPHFSKLPAKIAYKHRQAINSFFKTD